MHYLRKELHHVNIAGILCGLCGEINLPSSYFLINRPPDFTCHTTRIGLATNTDE